MATPARTLNKHRGRSSHRPSLTFVEAVGLGVQASRRVGSRLLDDLQARIEAWRLRLDPTTQQWVEESRRSMADGGFEERVRKQPTPAELVEQAKQARRSG
jgi:hypothetical protein